MFCLEVESQNPFWPSSKLTKQLNNLNALSLDRTEVILFFPIELLIKILTGEYMTSSFFLGGIVINDFK